MTAYIDDLPEPECSWPIVLVEHRQHVIWIEAATHADALDQLQNDSEWYEHIRDSETCAEAWYEANAPTKYDWDTVYEGGESYQGMRADAHVRSHEIAQQMARRSAERAACVVAGHPELRFGDAEAYCPNCGYLKTQQLVADIRAARERAAT